MALITSDSTTMQATASGSSTDRSWTNGNGTAWRLNVIALSTLTHGAALSAEVEINNTAGEALYSSQAADGAGRLPHLHFADGYYFSPSPEGLSLGLGDTIRTQCTYSTVRGPRLPIQDTSCCCHPLTGVPYSRFWTTQGPGSSKRVPGQVQAGHRPGEELCLAYLMVWPAEALRSPKCVSGPGDHVEPGAQGAAGLDGGCPL